MTKSTQNRLIVALGLALDEIHHPGSARTAGIDISALCQSVLREAAKADVPAMVRQELLRLARAA